MPADPPAPAPFVVGVARSGTTLLRLMLDAHPDLAIPAETHFVPAVLARGGPAPLEDYLAIVGAAPSRNDFGLAFDDLGPALAAHGPAADDDWDPTTFLRAFYRSYADRFGKPRWGDKTPTYLTAMPAIAAALPEATFIHLVRDARAVATSRRGLHFGPGASVRAQAEDWRDRILAGRSDGAGLGDRYREVRYEDLVTDPDAVLADLCRALDLPADPAMLAYHEHAEERLGELGDRQDGDGAVVVGRDQRLGIHAKTAGRPDPANIDRWRHDLAPEEVAEIEAVAGELMADLGYEPAGGAPR